VRGGHDRAAEAVTDRREGAKRPTEERRQSAARDSDSQDDTGAGSAGSTSVQTRFQPAAHGCGAVGCRRHAVLLLVVSDDRERVLCPPHAVRWVRRDDGPGYEGTAAREVWCR
jgi:hypothetical protein